MINDIDYNRIISEELEKMITELIANGRAREVQYEELSEYLKEICNKLMQYKDCPPNVIYDSIIDKYLRTVKGIASIVPGLATSIHDDTTGLSLETYSGVTKDDGEKIDENTRFDYASITKMFTAVEVLKLKEEGKFDDTKTIRELSNGKYPIDIPASKLEKFGVSLMTDGRVDEDIPKEEFERRLRDIKVREGIPYEYNDILYILLKLILPEDDEYFKRYFHDEMRLLDTSYEKFGQMTGGGTSSIDMPYDPKAKNMMKFGYKEPGHAGLFGTTRDLVKFHKNLRGFLEEGSIKDLITKENKEYSSVINGKTVTQNRAMGVYVNIEGQGLEKSGLDKGEVVPILSKDAFSATGSSGGYATFDKDLTGNFLSNPYSGDNPILVDTSDPKYNFGEAVEPGTQLRVQKKRIELYDKNGDPIRKIEDGKIVLDQDGNEVIETIPFVRITNELKEEQIKALLGLRLASRVLYRTVEEMRNYEEDPEYVKRRLDDSNLGLNTTVVKKL